jgi:DNA invertase Pin-like site-specific DNA recombinase
MAESAKAKPNNNNTAVIYRRVSTTKQAQEGWSLPAQLEACQEYAARAGLHVVRDFADTCTGTKASRPQFDAMLDHIEANGIGHVIVAVLDRLGREAAAVDRYFIGETGAMLHYTDSGRCPPTATG